MRTLLSLGLYLFLQLVQAGPLSNQLAGHASPYLAMHGADPVHWQTWNQSAFERARRENKLVFVSSGYFTCHWCHVMQRESYQNAATAAYINRHFIPVKIDRELLPDVDAGLIDFAQTTRAQAGWPLNVFLTPDGHPLIAVLYLPPQSFQVFLASLNARWSEDTIGLAQMAQRAAGQVARQQDDPAAEMDAQKLRQTFIAQALEQADELAGGFGAQSKFPRVPQLWTLLELQRTRADPRLADFLQLTLTQMAGQGLRDHLGGGFFRYTVDPAWQLPHFEKMLYDNALLARLYLRAARVFDEPAFAAVARHTLDFVLDHMAAPDGGYVAALSAVDGAGVEGGYYLWDSAQIEALAGEDWPLLSRYWNLTRAAPLDAGHHLIPHVEPDALAREFNLSVTQVQARIARVRTQLLEVRDERQLPVDDKVLTGWNSLLLTALHEAVRYDRDAAEAERYAHAAQALQTFLLTRRGRDGHWVRMRSAAEDIPATLEDCAYLLEALRSSPQSSAAQSHAQVLPALQRQAWESFYRDGAWWYGADRLLHWRGGRLTLTDGVLPSPAAVLLHNLTPRPEAAARAIETAYPLVIRNPFEHASYVTLY